jgi:DNA polymerase sigma
VLDPLDTSNNISHSTFRIKDIQRALVQAFKIINESCERFQQDEKEEEAKPKAVLDRLMTTIQQ